MAALDRARLAAECLFIDVSEYLEADRILEAAIDRAPPGPARADALSLRAIIRYYHGRVPQAIELGEQALEEAGDDPGLRAKVLGRLGYLVMQLDLERGVGLLDEAVGIMEAADGDGPVDPDTRRERPAPARRRGDRARPADTARGRRARPRPDLGRRPVVGEGGGRGQRVRAGSRHRRPGPSDRDDPGDDPRQVRAGRRRPVQRRDAVGPPALPRRVARGAAPGRGGGGGIPARGRRDPPGVGTPRAGPGGGARRAARRGARLGDRGRAARPASGATPSSSCSTTRSSASSRSRPGRGRRPTPSSRRRRRWPTGWPSDTRGDSRLRATRSRRRSRWATSTGRRPSSNGWTRRLASRRRRGSSPWAPGRRGSSRRRGVISTGRSNG